MTATVDAAVVPSERSTVSPAGPRWRRLPDPVTAAVVLAIAAFAVLGIGSPLWGQTALVETGLLNHVAPHTDGQFLDVGQRTKDLGDTVDGAIPMAGLFGDALREGGALERLVQHRRIRELVLVALFVAALLLGGPHHLDRPTRPSPAGHDRADRTSNQ